MHYPKLLVMLLATLVSIGLSAQSPLATSQNPNSLPQFSLSLALGTFQADDGLSADRSFSPFSAELGYQKPLSAKFSLQSGLGFQYRNQELITATGEPCVFPLGIKVVTFLDSESYTANQAEAFVRLGTVYHLKRFNFSAAVLPTVRLSNEFSYRFYRDFTVTNRPDAEIDQTVKSGGTLDLSAIGSGPRTVQYEQRFTVQAEIAADYLITSRLRLGLALHPVLSRNEVSITNQSFCSDVVCVDFSGESETVGSLRGTAGLVRLSFLL